MKIRHNNLLSLSINKSFQNAHAVNDHDHQGMKVIYILIQVGKVACVLFMSFFIFMTTTIHPSIQSNEFSHNDSRQRNSDLCIPYLPHNLTITITITITINITCYRMYQRNQLNTTYQHRPPFLPKKKALYKRPSRFQITHPPSPHPTPPLPSSSLSKKFSLVLLFGFRSSLGFGSLLYLR